MFRLSSLALLLILLGCATDQSEPSICYAPERLRGWNGVTVRMIGVLEGGYEHGYTLLDEDCARGGKLANTGYAIDDRLMKAFFEVDTTGTARIDVDAKIEALDGDPPMLRIVRIYGRLLKPMSDQQLDSFDRKHGPLTEADLRFSR
jgi:hypothetical protein